jgi:UDP-glucose 4-epimerase
MERRDGTTLQDTSVLVTGGAGFIGSHLTERLVGLGADVTVIDDLSAGARDNLAAVLDDVRFVDGDIRARDTVADCLAGVEMVFHLAANAHVPTSVERPRHDFEVNASGTQVVLEEAREAGVERVVLASSAAVYGPPESVPIDETHPLNPISPYGASKLAGEKLGMAYDDSYDLDVTALRIFNTYGPRQPRYVMYDFLQKLEADPSALEVLGSGEETRTFVYVSDTVAAFLALAVAEEAPGRAFNIGGTDPTRIRDLAELLCDRYYDGEPEVYTTGESKPGDIERLITDNSRIRELGVEPSIPLAEGVDDLYEWFQRAVSASTTTPASGENQ